MACLLVSFFACNVFLTLFLKPKKSLSFEVASSCTRKYLRDALNVPSFHFRSFETFWFRKMGFSCTRMQVYCRPMDEEVKKTSCKSASRQADQSLISCNTSIVKTSGNNQKMQQVL